MISKKYVLQFIKGVVSASPLFCCLCLHWGFDELNCPLSKSGKRKKIGKNPEQLQTTQKLRRDDDEQVTYDLTVLFSLIFVLNL